MRVVCRGRRHWVIEYGGALPDVVESEPYATRAEAERDKRGIAEFLRVDAGPAAAARRRITGEPKAQGARR